jgi:hypothetical protein
VGCHIVCLGVLLVSPTTQGPAAAAAFAACSSLGKVAFGWVACVTAGRIPDANMGLWCPSHHAALCIVCANGLRRTQDPSGPFMAGTNLPAQLALLQLAPCPSWCISLRRTNGCCVVLLPCFMCLQRALHVGAAPLVSNGIARLAGPCSVVAAVRLSSVVCMFWPVFSST